MDVLDAYGMRPPSMPDASPIDLEENPLRPGRRPADLIAIIQEVLVTP